MSRGHVAMIFLETPSNPTNTLIDFALINRIADEIANRQKRRPIIACDNTLLGPIFKTHYCTALIWYSTP